MSQVVRKDGWGITLLPEFDKLDRINYNFSALKLFAPSSPRQICAHKRVIGACLDCHTPYRTYPVEERLGSLGRFRPPKLPQFSPELRNSC